MGDGRLRAKIIALLTYDTVKLTHQGELKRKVVKNSWMDSI